MAFSGIITISYFHSFYVKPFINTLNCSKDYTQVSFYRIGQSNAESYFLKVKKKKENENFGLGSELICKYNYWIGQSILKVKLYSEITNLKIITCI